MVSRAHQPTSQKFDATRLTIDLGARVYHCTRSMCKHSVISTILLTDQSLMLFSLLDVVNQHTVIAL